MTRSRPWSPATVARCAHRHTATLGEVVECLTCQGRWPRVPTVNHISVTDEELPYPQPTVGQMMESAFHRAAERMGPGWEYFGGGFFRDPLYVAKDSGDECDNPRCVR